MHNKLSECVVAIFFSSVVAASAASCLAPSSSLVAWWPGDGNPNDIVGTNNGALQNGASSSAIGIVGQAFSLTTDRGFQPLVVSVFRSRLKASIH